MDLKDVEKLVAIVEKEGLASIKIEDGDTKIEIKRQGDAAVQTVLPQAVHQAPTAMAPAKTTETIVKEEVVSGKQILSPMAGTFYSSPSPDEPSFIKVGDQVNQGDVVCIVEAMKTFNRLESEHSGVVAKILVSSGDPVEPDQPLILLK